MNPSCTSAATDTQKQAIETVIEDSPEVESYRFETKEEAFEKVKELLGEDQFGGPNPVMTAEDMSGGLLDHAGGPQGVRAASPVP